MSRLLRNRVAGDRSSHDRAVGSGTGPTVSNELPVPVDNGEPSADQQSRRGAIPLMATAETAASSAEGRSGLRSPPTGSSAISRQTSQRMKWTKEMNISILHAYYISTKVETEYEGFRVRMHAEWKRMYPDSTLNEQRVCSQLNSIQRRRVFSDAELNRIKQQIATQLQSSTSLESPFHGEEQEEEIGGLLERERVAENQASPISNEHLINELQESYQKYRIMYEGVPLQKRPRIPKVIGSAKFYAACKEMNSIVENTSSELISLEELSDAVHCAALAVCSVLGRKIREENSRTSKDPSSKNEFIPTWKKIIISKINKSRKEISHLSAYFAGKGKVPKKVRNGIRSIAKRMKLRMNLEDLDMRLKDEEERLKQKIAALGARIRRYDEAAKRRQQQSAFAFDQKKFYRQLQNGNEDHQGQFPSGESLVQYWTDIWAKPKHHNEGAYWLQGEREACRNIDEMPPFEISLADIKTAVQRTQNWKSPGPDGIQNVWWKYFTATHSCLTRLFNEALRDPTTFPKYLLTGRTYMVPKAGDRSQPRNYRPITCLPTLYKILTSIISSRMYSHLVDQRILAAEQNGCRKGNMGCKELLVIDSVITQQVRKHQRNLSVGWIDYKKAFDSVPHSWLLRVLDLYKIDRSLIGFLKNCMSEWKTHLQIKKGNCWYLTEDIAIRRGIFQGDSLSPLWFCIALTPLSRMLRQSGYGYLVKKNPDVRISHQLYMDDLKLYASNRDHLQNEIELVKSFSDAVCMEFGIDKCATLHVVRGQIQNGEQNMQISGDTVIKNIGTEDSYKYLGMLQLLGIFDSDVRNKIVQNVLSRVNKVCKTWINSRSKISAINTWAIPVATYTFGVIKWTETSLQTFDRKIRTTLTRHRLHHPQSSVHRLYLPRDSAGRGLLNLEVLCRQQEEKLRRYFLSINTSVHKAICDQDKKMTPLCLAQLSKDFDYLKHQDRVNIWQRKELHGRFFAALTSENIDKKSSVEWLRTGGLFGETEGFLFSIQDQVVKTRAYKKFIMGQQIDSRCRLCKSTNESIQHICCGCPALAQTEYLKRHNCVAKVIHQALAKRYDLVESEQPYYKCKPEQVISNDRARILWDSTIITDRTVEANRPDIVLFDKISKTSCIIDVAVPTDDRLVTTVAEKKRKYQPLAVELKDMYGLRAVEVLPVVVSANGLVTKEWQETAKKLKLTEKHLRTIQKAALLGTANIVRKFLSLN